MKPYNEIASKIRIADLLRRGFWKDGDNYTGIIFGEKHTITKATIDHLDNARWADLINGRHVGRLNN
jgi:hypothetical protein